MSQYPEVRSGDYWQHYHGAVVKIIGVAVEEDNHARRIVYRNLETGLLMLQPHWHFFQDVTRKVTVNGVEGTVTGPRFIRVESVTAASSDPARATNTAIKERYPDR